MMMMSWYLTCIGDACLVMLWKAVGQGPGARVMKCAYLEQEAAHPNSSKWASKPRHDLMRRCQGVYHAACNIHAVAQPVCLLPVTPG
jgi:hypothetical protein